MGGFVFRLQKVLDHRLRIEDEKKLAFVKSRLAYLSEEEELEMLYKKLEESVCDTLEKSTGIFSYIARHNYLVFLEQRIEEQKRKVEICKQEMMNKKILLEESQKDRKVIDKLKENSLKEYNQYYEKLEQKQNDEFALYGYVRK